MTQLIKASQRIVELLKKLKTPTLFQKSSSWGLILLLRARQPGSSYVLNKEQIWQGRLAGLYVLRHLHTFLPYLYRCRSLAHDSSGYLSRVSLTCPLFLQINLGFLWLMIKSTKLSSIPHSPSTMLTYLIIWLICSKCVVSGVQSNIIEKYLEFFTFCNISDLVFYLRSQ